jgi:putative sterol carrier protein
MAVCPAGEVVIGPFLADRKSYTKKVVKPLQEKEETVNAVPGSDGEAYAARHFPHKAIRWVGTGLRPDSVLTFLRSLPLLFQRDQSEGLGATYHFTFTGEEECKGTVVIGDKTIEVKEGHVGTPDLHVTADSRTWIDFLAKEKNLLWAIMSRKIRIKGPPRLLKAFARCFPS